MTNEPESAPAAAGPRGPDRREQSTPRISRYSFRGGRRRKPPLLQVTEDIVGTFGP